MPNGRCRMHGGSSLRGIASPTFVHGRHSRDLPTRLIPRFRESEKDPDLLNLSAEISLIDTRIAEIEKRIDVDGGGALWGSLGGIVVAFESARDANDMDGIAEVTDALRSTIQRAQGDQRAWEDIVQLIEQRRKLVESEAKRRVAMQDMISSDRAMLLVTQLVDAVARHVHDRPVLAAISAEFGAILARDDPPAA